MSDDEFASKFMDAIFSPSEQGIPTNEENKRKAREYLSSLRTLAAQAKANEADAERWRKVVELITDWNQSNPCAGHESRLISDIFDVAEESHA